MIDLIFIFKIVHLLGAAVLFGTGIGIAFFMLMAHRTANASVVAYTARVVVIADFIFTATAAVLQPISGLALAYAIGLSPFEESWIVISIVLYVVVGLCWLPVVVIQMRMRDVAHAAAVGDAPLPDEYYRLFRIWFVLGWPAFLGVIAIFVFMTWQPHWW